MYKERIGIKFNKLTVKEFVGREIRKDGHGTHLIYLFECECGNEIRTRINSVVSGNTKSCGCLLKNLPQRQSKLPNSIGGFLRVYRGYYFSCKKRKRVFNLTQEQFKEINQKNCHYCGCKPEKIMSTGNKFSSYIYNGIDRVDNSIGYTVENCVPCCECCNKAKGTKSYSEFIEWINGLIIFRSEKC